VQSGGCDSWQFWICRGPEREDIDAAFEDKALPQLGLDAL
jgi:hypothetical protein